MALPLGTRTRSSTNWSGRENCSRARTISDPDRPTTNTVVFRAGSLAPGQSTNFTGSYTVPGNCCTVTDTLTVSAQDACPGPEVGDTSTAICPVIFTPRIEVTKDCPVEPAVPGEPLTYSGTVSNAGNITLTDVVVYNDITGPSNPISLSATCELRNTRRK